MTKVETQLDVLRKKSKKVESPVEAREIISKLENAITDSTLSHAVGLAAIQIGIPKKVAIIERVNSRTGEKSLKTLINAEVVSKEDPFVFKGEGCLSFPEVFRNTERFRHYVIKNYVIDDSDSKEFREETLYFYYADDTTEVGHSGLTAIAVQHEMDHFNGRVILDYNLPCPVKTKKAKIGRNDPCPCGSEKKYKKCCLNKT